MQWQDRKSGNFALTNSTGGMQTVFIFSVFEKTTSTLALDKKEVRSSNEQQKEKSGK